jgi:hypothetical protein
VTRAVAAPLLRLASLVAVTGAVGACSVGQQLVADNADLRDYRAFRVAAPEGLRLSRASSYLAAHPAGQWAAEVRAAFDAEEPGYFEACQASREKAREYLIDLPNGPHAAAALALLVEYSQKVEDVATARLLKDARRTEAKLEAAAGRRRAVGEAILAATGALVAEGVYGARIEDTPAALRRVLGGEATVSWGTTPARRDADTFFVIPSPDGRQERVATLTVRVIVEAGVVVEGRIEGNDLFVRWDEADLVRPLDASSQNHRSAAAFHAQELLAGALEARLPEARCTEERKEGELLRRACDGWSAVVRWGQAEGEPDVVAIRGPSPGKMR